MLGLFQPKTSKAESAPPAPAPIQARGSPGAVLYAIGDVHGRADLLAKLLQLLRQDAAETAGDARTLLLFLGDYVDRGPDSKGVIDLILNEEKAGRFQITAIRGNHDQYVLDFLETPGNGGPWLDYGGGSTLASYGVRPPRTRTDSQAWAEAAKALAEGMPAEHLAFLKGTHLAANFGDYVFVHAGVRPGAELNEQEPMDLMAIRGPFLKSKQPLSGRVVVFGHTPCDRPYLKDGKMALDTGAYATGILTAARISEDQVRFIQTG